MTLSQQIEEKIKQDAVLQKGDKIFIACSGGPDSTALVHLLKDLGHWKFNLSVVHFNHRLRKSSKQDEIFVKSLGKKWKIPVILGRRSPGSKNKKDSLEEAARSWRYEFFIQSAKHRKIRKVLLAHTRDDQAETVLMRMIQGTGLRGLLGIRKKIMLEGIIFYRPLLDVSKQELLQYLKEKGIAFRHDPTNRSLRLLRNRIRHQLLPEIQKHYNPRAIHALSRIPQAVGEEDQALTFFENQFWKKNVIQTKGRIIFSQARWSNLPAGVQFRVLDRALKILHLKSGLNYKLWTDLKQHLQKRNYRANFPRALDFCIQKGKVVVSHGKMKPYQRLNTRLRPLGYGAVRPTQKMGEIAL